MILKKIFGQNEELEAGRRLYEAAVAQAREKAFYARLGVPDTLDGRFDSIILHVWLILRRLRSAGDLQEQADALSQAVFDAMVADLDRSLREMGVGDLRVGKRVKAMAKAFYGRLKAYDEGMAESNEAMAEALGRNLYGTAEEDRAKAAHIAAYVVREMDNLAAQPAESLLTGNVEFGPVEEGERH